jgi:hypothetical protein
MPHKKSMSRHQLAACASASLYVRESVHRPLVSKMVVGIGSRLSHALSEALVRLGLQLYHLFMQDTKEQMAHVRPQYMGYR